MKSTVLPVLLFIILSSFTTSKFNYYLSKEIHQKQQIYILRISSSSGEMKQPRTINIILNDGSRLVKSVTTARRAIVKSHNYSITYEVVLTDTEFEMMKHKKVVDYSTTE